MSQSQAACSAKWVLQSTAVLLFLPTPVPLPAQKMWPSRGCHLHLQALGTHGLTLSTGLSEDSSRAEGSRVERLPYTCLESTNTAGVG